MKILLVCSSGFSSSLLMKKMKDYWMEEENELDIQAVSLYEDHDTYKDFDVILIAPQIGYCIDQVKRETGLPCAIIPGMDYGTGNCANIFNLIKQLF